jgi:hypothetical protein
MRELDPEDARAVIDPVLQLMMDAVHHYDGYVVQSAGDGIFALFGAPVAHEDHPQRAVHAALAMRDALRRRAGDGTGRVGVEVRIGISTGEVVLRLVYTGGHTEYTPVGHTANLAAKMQSVAPTGGIVISEDTQRLVEGYFELRELGPTEVRGVAEPINVYEVTGAGPLHGHFDLAVRRGLTRFVGREREILEMKRALELVRGGHGQIVAIVPAPFPAAHPRRDCHRSQTRAPAALQIARRCVIEQIRGQVEVADQLKLGQFLLHAGKTRPARVAAQCQQHRSAAGHLRGTIGLRRTE